MSKREEMRRRRQQKAHQRQLIIIGAIVVVALAVTGWLIWQNTRPIGEFVTLPTQEYPLAEGKSMGSVDAPVTITIFSDFQCPFCGQVARGVEKQVIDTFVNSGQARLVYKHYIVVDGNVGGSESRRAAEASECAAEQGQFWNFHDMVFANQQGEGRGAFADRRLEAFAAAIGLDTGQFNACFNSNRYAGAVRADEAEAAQLGITGTPTVFINGVRVENPTDYAEYERLIAQQLLQ
ncbi:MAG: thioredoxin domain-containing protein [Anaerolineales bacterium]|nr:thioredoxin domain-containing protein [Anaerolineales bacterium]